MCKPYSNSTQTWKGRGLNGCLIHIPHYFTDECPNGGPVPQRTDPDLTANCLTQAISPKLAGANLNSCELSSNTPLQFR